MNITRFQQTWCQSHLPEYFVAVLGYGSPRLRCLRSVLSVAETQRAPAHQLAIPDRVPCAVCSWQTFSLRCPQSCTGPTTLPRHCCYPSAPQVHLERASTGWNSGPHPCTVWFLYFGYAQLIVFPVHQENSLICDYIIVASCIVH